MPRVVAEYKVQARRRIVEAAQRVFRRKGFRAATMDDVAREIGVSKGAIYLYFRAKSELLAAIQTRSREQVMVAWNRLLEAGDVPEGIAASLDEVFSGAIDPGVWHELITEATSDPEVRETLRRDDAEDRKVMRDFLRRLERRGRIRPLRDPATVAEIVLSLLHGAVVQSTLRGDPRAARRTLVRELHFLLDRGG